MVRSLRDMSDARGLVVSRGAGSRSGRGRRGVGGA